jgi:serine/threonine protein kinase
MMAHENRDRLIELVGEAMSRPAPEREAYVRDACAVPAARDEALSLLAALERAGGFMGNPTVAAARAGGREIPGAMIGRYELLELIGEGGFGHVFMAEQREPVVRRVALKIIRPGMDSRVVVARFEAERQALAMMDHPGIATVLDGGETESGRPYFAMELVKGVPITTFCDREKMAVPDRLALFRDVCGAVQHAHQKGVIHRDLKPTNVLVSERDGRAQAKIIDFGIAKATFGRLTDRTLFTEFRQFIGTPEYMSPEQTLGTGADVDTRSDIYSLGVVLYELLTGTTPLDRESLRSASLGDMQRLIRETETPRPSTRLSTMGARSDVAAHRRTEPGRLGLLLRGDLDWIVLKALEKDRERRYETAGALAEDVRRFLEDEPVSATPPSVPYRVRKFVRRHRGAVLGGSLVGVALVLGVIGTSAGLVSSIKEKNRATEVKGFLASMLDSVKPGVAHGEDTALMRRVLDEAAARLNSGEVTDPLIEAELRQTIGVVYDQIGESGAAEPMLRRATELRAGVLGAHDPDTLGPQVDLGGVLLRLGRAAESEKTLRAALAGLRSALGDRHTSTLDALNSLGVTLEKQGRYADAAACFREALDGLTEVAGPEEGTTVAATYNLGFALWSLGRYPEAEPYMRRALEVRRRTLGDDSPATLTTMSALAGLLGATARPKEAEQLLLEALAASRRIFPPDHPDTLAIVNNLGGLLTETGRAAEAEPYLREALDGLRRRFGNDHSNTLNAIANMAAPLQASGRLDEAEAMHREAIEGMRRSPEMGPEHPRTLLALITFGTFLRDRKKLDEAEPVAREAYDGCTRVLDPGHPWRLAATHCLGLVLRSRGKLDEAEPLLREALVGRRKALGPNHPRTLNSAGALGLVLADLGRFGDAEQQLLDTLDGLKPAGDEATPWARGATPVIEALVYSYTAWEKAEPGAGHDAQAAAWRAKSPSRDPGGG